jgi:exodeoxyribonuclease VII small subunit
MLAELEQIVRELEDGKTGLEESLTRYEAGVHLLKRCYQQLADAERRIVLLTGEDEEGRPVTQAFEHAASADGDGKPRRNRRLGGSSDGLF